MRPRSVRWVRLRSRRSRGPPSSSSSFWMARVSAGGVTWRRSAAWVKFKWSATATAASRRRRKLGLRVALTGLVMITVVVTALLIHLTWSYTARRNVRDVAGQLNNQIIESVRHELRQTLDNAWAVQRALQSIFV